MKVRTLLILLTLASWTTTVPARTDKRDEKRGGAKVERKIPADAQVWVSTCLSSGSIKVNGWDRNEVRARSSEAAEIEFKRNDDGNGPAKKIELLIADKSEELGKAHPCEAFSEVELDVPRGATVQLKTRDSDIGVYDVAAVYVSTQNGDVSIERATRTVDAGTVGGGISLKESTGRISLHSVGGSIVAIDVRPAEDGDPFEARSLGGEITLERVTHGQLTARTLNGSLCVTGPLAHSGRYSFHTMSGDLTLTLPQDSSFQLSARFSRRADIITDFPITLLSQSSAQPAPAQNPVPPVPASPRPTPKVTPAPKVEAPHEVVKVKTKKGTTVVVDVSSLGLRRIEGIHGSGDAKLDLSSFSGTIHLQKQ